MPFGNKPKCVECSLEESLIWWTSDNGSLCNNCYQKKKGETRSNLKDSEQNIGGKAQNTEVISTPKITLRKSTRMTRNYKTRQNAYTTPKSNLKGRSKKVSVKTRPLKSSASTMLVPVVSNQIWHRGHYFKVGDIVSVVDIDGSIYYAQIRGLLANNYCEVSAVISWLLPTAKSPPPKEKFDPSTYILGPDEESPRSLESMKFVMHSPSEYFMSTKMLYPPPVTDQFQADDLFTKIGC